MTPEEAASIIVDNIAGGLDYRAYEATKLAIAEAIRGVGVTATPPITDQGVTSQVAALRSDLADRWGWPDARDSFLFLVTEVGELGDAMLRCEGPDGGATYARCNPRVTTVENIADEMADVMIMLATLALAYNVCLEDALKTKMEYLRRSHGKTP
jgi:NTP pyrophosphatase (non-canonical NTP hydrolase)